MLKTPGQIFTAAGLALFMFLFGPGKLFGLGPIVSGGAEVIVLCIAVLSLGTPKGFMWLTLTTWAFYFAWWSLYELTWFQKGDETFGPMLIPYGIGSLVFAAAAFLSFGGKGSLVRFRGSHVRPANNSKAH